MCSGLHTGCEPGGSEFILYWTDWYRVVSIQSYIDFHGINFPKYMEPTWVKKGSTANGLDFHGELHFLRYIWIAVRTKKKYGSNLRYKIWSVSGVADSKSEDTKFLNSIPQHLE